MSVVPLMNPDNGVEFARSEKGEWKYSKMTHLTAFVRIGGNKG
jgi:hypothetical protein